MTIKMLSLALAMSLAGAASLPAVAQAAPAAAANAAAADVVVKVNGLVCDFCARSLEKTFRKTGKISGVSVDLTAKEVRLKFAPGASLDDPTIRKLVKDAGYAVVDVRRAAG